MDTSGILTFLTVLRKNNNREWMEANKAASKEARADFEKIVKALLQGISGFDAGLNGVEPKDCIFRSNRDIRFSKDKSPYKTNFGASMAPGGKKSMQAVYYFHLQPGNESFVAGGLYMPSGEQLKKVRQEIDYNAAELKNIISKADFINYFGTIQGEKLKKAPKGYSTDHPNIEFMRLKSYVVLHKMNDEAVLSRNFANDILPVYKAMHPFNEFLNIAVS